jgi:ABC-2 type transport system ATP-binding protein
MANAVEAEHIAKTFGGLTALRDLSFVVHEGEIYGLIGPNGAGKTTALRITGTLIRPTSGSIKVFDIDAVKEPSSVRQLLSYLPEEAGAYRSLSGYEYLKFMASFHAKTREDINKMVAEGASISGLSERLGDRIKGYSKGMVRRLLLARALMVKPRLAILDEPTGGLDVVHALHIRQTIREHSEKLGMAILLSSHNMLEVEYLCTTVALLDQGRIVAQGRPSELMDLYGAENLEEVFVEAVKRG